MAYKILKNSGYLPPELETRKEINRPEKMIAETEDEHLRIMQLRKLNFLTMDLDSMREKASLLMRHPDYTRRTTENITLHSKEEPA